MRRNLLRLALIVGLYSNLRAFPQERPDPPAYPKAEALFDTYIEVTGGRKAYEKLKSRTASGTFVIESLGVKGKVQTWQKAPDRLRSVTEMAEFGRSERGVIDGVAWEISPSLGAGLHDNDGPTSQARILDGAERAFLLREATFNADLNWKKVCKSAETVGEDEVSGKPAWKIRVETIDGATMHLYYDQYSNLLVRVDASVKTALGAVDVQAYPTDYRKVNGILVPHKSTQKMMGITQTATFDTIKFNEPIPDSKFALPPEVKKLAPGREPPNRRAGNKGPERSAPVKRKP